MLSEKDAEEIKNLLPTVCSFDDVMSYLRVSKSTVYRLISSGELQAFKEDGAGEWNILRSDLLAFLEGAER